MSPYKRKHTHTPHTPHNTLYSLPHRYLPAKLWSPRFDSTFFTATVGEPSANPSKVPGVLYYPIRVRCGKTEWLAERRYSEFLPLVQGELKRASGRRGGGGSDEAGRLEAAAAATAAVRAALPPKGYCKAPTPSFLVHRREGLQEVLSQLLSMEGSSRAQDVRKFLELDQGEDLSLPFSPGPPSRA